MPNVELVEEAYIGRKVLAAAFVIEAAKGNLHSKDQIKAVVSSEGGL
jgi:hypothetical protein